ncbi:hypothetical protein TNCV_3607211 [Trichonephila clavipes]|nr:hypothetical protein TNCV_3607211 [Trichonephila clavipes]
MERMHSWNQLGRRSRDLLPPPSLGMETGYLVYKSSARQQRKERGGVKEWKRKEKPVTHGNDLKPRSTSVIRDLQWKKKGGSDTGGTAEVGGDFEATPLLADYETDEGGISRTTVADMTSLNILDVVARLSSKHSVYFQWVSSHIGFNGNEIVDSLAKSATAEALRGDACLTFAELSY